MKIAEIQFSPWDKIYYFSLSEEQIAQGDYVVVETKLGTEMGKVVGFSELTEDEIGKLPEPLKPILRKANKEDLEIVLQNKRKKSAAFNDCRALIKKFGLPIKLVDVHFTFDGSKITFAFIADGRVDFRELLKELIKIHKKKYSVATAGHPRRNQSQRRYRMLRTQFVLPVFLQRSGQCYFRLRGFAAGGSPRFRAAFRRLWQIKMLLDL